MNVITVIRQVPEGESALRLSGDAIDLSGTELAMDTMDEYGVEQALRLREAGNDLGIIALAVGPQRNETALRSALALGADRAIHVETDLALDPIALSSIVAQIAREEAAELILCGGRQADWDSEALGGAVAERLGWPQLTWTTELTLTGDTLTGRHDTDDGTEGFTVQLPALVTTQQGLNEPRYPTLPNLMKARKKELRKETLDRFHVAPLARIVRTELQARERLQKIVTAGDDLPTAIAPLAVVLRKETEARA